MKKSKILREGIKKVRKRNNNCNKNSFTVESVAIVRKINILPLSEEYE